MTTERTETLLQEIRDAQREHLDLYREAFANQQASIQSQQEAIAYQKRMVRVGLLIILPVLALVVGLIIWITLSFL